MWDKPYKKWNLTYTFIQKGFVNTTNLSELGSNAEHNSKCLTFDSKGLKSKTATSLNISFLWNVSKKGPTGTYEGTTGTHEGTKLVQI